MANNVSAGETLGSGILKEGFDPRHFAELARFESHNFWFKSRNRLIIWALGKYCSTAGRFLEIGCGTGFVLSAIARAFPQLDISGSELFEEGLRLAAQRVPQARLQCLNALHMPYKEEFDVIGAFDVLEHIEDDQTVLRQIYNSLKPGGVIVLTVPQHQFLWSPSDGFARHVRRYSGEDLLGKLSTAGFLTVRKTSYVSLLLPMMMLARLMQRLKPEKFDLMSELSIAGWQGNVLEWILSFELMIIWLGFSFPLGGSLMVVAKKAQVTRCER